MEYSGDHGNLVSTGEKLMDEDGRRYRLQKANGKCCTSQLEQTNKLSKVERERGKAQGPSKNLVALNTNNMCSAGGRRSLVGGV